MGEDIVKLARRLESAGDHGRVLSTIVETRRALDLLEAGEVDAALHDGWSWSRIAEALEVSKQAAHRKHSRRRRATSGTSAPGAKGVPPRSEHLEPARRRLTVTGEARRAVEYARQEAHGLGARAVAPEHLLLGLLRGRGGIAARALEEAGLELEGARIVVGDAAAGSPGEGAQEESPAPSRPTILPATRAIFEQSLREAVAHGDAHLGVEHVLLALVSSPSTGTTEVLVRVGVSEEQVRERLRDAVARSPAAG